MRKPPLSMTNAAVVSVPATKARSVSSIFWMSSSISCGRVAMFQWACSGVLRLRSGLVDEFMEQEARNHVERLENAFAFMRGGGKSGGLGLAIVQQVVEVFSRRGIGQIAF